MIHPARICCLNDDPVCEGPYVLYWMQTSQRAEHNHALEYAVAEANRLDRPLVVAFGLTDGYPEANQRHYVFMLQGLRDVNAALRHRGIRFVVQLASPDTAALNLTRNASLVVCDRGYLRHQKQWRQRVAEHAHRRVVQVETDVVVPVEAASDKHEFSARTIRPRIHRLWDDFLHGLRAFPLKRTSLSLNVPSDIDPDDIDGSLARLDIDRTVAPSPRFVGGTTHARRILRQFLRENLRGYADRHDDPALAASSTLSPYLHFGQISPVEIALEVLRRPRATAADRDAYLEQLIVRRELSINHVHYTAAYDSYDCLPLWARLTLRQHRRDKRPYLYTRDQLDAAATHDPFWNAAQREMVRTGFMHGYMRMYWGKKILEWKRTPQAAFADALYLNNRYFLCGRDPNAYGNVAWLFGLHDRPFSPRPVFGTVRYMNAAGLQRKFDMSGYLRSNT